MKPTLKQLLAGISLLTCATLALATPTYTATQQSAVQKMVAGSSQQLYYNLASQATNSVVVTCTFQTTDGTALQSNFNDAGCITGVGLNKSVGTIQTLLTLTVPTGTATGTYTGNVVFSGGSQNPTYTFPVSITVTANSTRTVTFKNYCSEATAPGGVVIGVTSSSVPARSKNVTGGIACTSDSDCSTYAYSTCSPEGFCGWGACIQDSNCANTNTGTCTLPSATAKAANCTYCASDADCYDGASCASNNLCFWDLPSPTGNTTPTPDSDFRLGAYDPNTEITPYQATMTFPDHAVDNSGTLVWGGGFAGRTNCTWNAGSPGYYDCETADCNSCSPGPCQAGSVDGACVLSQTFTVPSTSPEITFVAHTPDTYDTTVINGMNIPLAIYPNNTLSPSAYNNPYICGSPGATNDIVTSGGTLGGCSWNVSLPNQFGTSNPNNGLQWIDAQGIVCTTNTQCTTAGDACGLTQSQITTGTGEGNADTHCGRLLGYFTQNEICALNSTYDKADVVDCTKSYGGNTMIDLLSCSSANGGGAGTSCYNVDGLNSSCGGCTDW